MKSLKESYTPRYLRKKREKCVKNEETNGDDSFDVITSQEPNDVTIRPDPVINDSFAENVNEVLMMLDHESNDQDREQEVDKGNEATESPNHEINDQELFLEPEPDQ